jgi:hypothetical protein
MKTRKEVADMIIALGKSLERNDALCEEQWEMLDVFCNIPEEWAECERLADLPQINEVLFNFGQDPTGDNGICLVREIRREIRGVR